MRIAELSLSTGVPVATIKYYLREGLLFPGARSAPNQAQYDAGHVRRLHLIRVLIDVGGLRLTSVRAVLEAVDDRDLPLHQLMGVAHHALGPSGPDGPPHPGPAGEDGEAAAARRDTDSFLEARGWKVGAGAPARRTLAGVLMSLRRLGYADDAEVLDPYAAAAEELAAGDLASISGGGRRNDIVEHVVAGTVVFEAAFVALRRLAQEHHSAVRFGAVQLAGPLEEGARRG